MKVQKVRCFGGFQAKENQISTIEAVRRRNQNAPAPLKTSKNAYFLNFHNFLAISMA